MLASGNQPPSPELINGDVSLVEERHDRDSQIATAFIGTKSSDLSDLLPLLRLPTDRIVHNSSSSSCNLSRSSCFAVPTRRRDAHADTRGLGSASSTWILFKTDSVC